MGSIPAFHARAAEEAEARTKAAQSNRNRADQFLSELDEILSEEEDAEPAA